MPVIILGGFFTATESAALAVIYEVMIARFCYKEISRGRTCRGSWWNRP
jgi:TRAP-type C4-dicarboxylate transport system permease large subunit